MHLSGCGGRLSEVAVATAKRRCSGDAPCHARSRCRFTGGAILQSCRLHFTSIGRSTGCNAVARPDCGLLHVFLAAFGRLVGEMRVEGRRGRRRPWKPNAIRMHACCFCVTLEAAIHRPQFQSAGPPPSPLPLKGSRHRVAVINVIASCDGKCALDTHGALNSVDHCTQGPPLRRSCASTQSRPGLYN